MIYKYSTSTIVVSCSKHDMLHCCCYMTSQFNLCVVSRCHLSHQINNQKGDELHTVFLVERWHCFTFMVQRLCVQQVCLFHSLQKDYMLDSTKPRTDTCAFLETCRSYCLLLNFMFWSITSIRLSQILDLPKYGKIPCYITELLMNVSFMSHHVQGHKTSILTAATTVCFYTRLGVHNELSSECIYT